MQSFYQNADISSSSNFITLQTLNCIAQTAYITNNGANTVSVINVATNTVSTTIAVGSNPWGVSVSPDGLRVYVANYEAASVSVINPFVPIPAKLLFSG
jgi:YVTN family beta-propeller protein